MTKDTVTSTFYLDVLIHFFYLFSRCVAATWDRNNLLLATQIKSISPAL